MTRQNFDRFVDVTRLFLRKLDLDPVASTVLSVGVIHRQTHSSLIDEIRDNEAQILEIYMNAPDIWALIARCSQGEEVYRISLGVRVICECTR